jgi:hypothetical protein
MVIIALALIAIPYLDRGGSIEPKNWAEAMNWSKRGWAFAAMAIFWVVLIIGTITNLITPVG